MIVERIEEDIVIIECDNGRLFEVNKSKFPENVKEGDFILKSDDSYVIGIDKTLELQEKMAELQNSLWN